MKGFRAIFFSAITDENGRVDAGYLALFWTMFTCLNAVGCILGLGGYSIYKLDPPNMKEAGTILMQVGVAIGACCTGAATVIAAVGAFRMGDKPRKEPIDDSNPDLPGGRGSAGRGDVGVP